MSSYKEPLKMNLVESKVKAKQDEDYKKRLRSIECSKKSKYLDNNLDPIIMNRTNNKFTQLKENQINYENRILMSKLQKISLPDPGLKIEDEVHRRDTMVKKRYKSQKSNSLNRQVEIAIENERIRQKLEVQDSRYNFSNCVFNFQSAQKKNESCLWNDAVDYAGTYKSVNNKDVIFEPDGSGNEDRNASESESFENKKNETYYKAINSRSVNDSPNRNYILSNKQRKFSINKRPDIEVIAGPSMTLSSSPMKSRYVNKRDGNSPVRSSQGRRIIPESFDKNFSKFVKKLKTSEISESPARTDFLNKTYNVQNSSLDKSEILVRYNKPGSKDKFRVRSFGDANKHPNTIKLNNPKGYLSNEYLKNVEESLIKKKPEKTDKRITKEEKRHPMTQNKIKVVFP